MDVFVAGATGVLGQPTVRALVAAGHSVRGIARGEEKAALLRSLGAEPVPVDIFDASALKGAVAGNDAVFSLATKIPTLTHMRSKGAWAENDRVRREGSRNIVDAALAAGAQVCIQESISFVYAGGGDRWLTEESPVELTWVNMQSALEAEQQNERFRASSRGIVLRFAAFYAPYASSTISTINLARRRFFPVIGRGDNYFSSIHVDDAAQAIVAALEAPSGLYNIADDEPLTFREFADALAMAFGFKAPRRVPAWLGRLFLGGPAAYLLRSHRVSNSRFKETTGWSPVYRSAREGWSAIAEALNPKAAV